MAMRFKSRTLAVLGAVAAFLGVTSRGEATQRFGPLQLSGNLQAQQLVRHPDVDQFQFIQQRNTARIRIDWEWVPRGGKFLDRFEIPYVERSQFLLLYRGVYDSVYDLTPEMRTSRTFQGERVDKRFDNLSDLTRGARDALKYENAIREAYVDLKLKDIPLSLRIGKQQVIWGESDGFRMLDRANPLDLSWHFFQELPPPAYGLDDLRIPLWMLKGLYDIGSVGSWSNVFAEAYWGLGDWRPTKYTFLPNPWGVRIGNPLTNPQSGAFYAIWPNITRLMNGTSLSKGDYTRNPIDNGQWGIRFNGVAGDDTPIIPTGMQLQIGYLYQRFQPAGGVTTSAALVRGLPPTDAGNIRTQQLVQNGTLPVEYYTPYIHTIGIAANYFDEWTKVVWRTEQSYDFGIPFYSCGHSPSAIAKQGGCLRETTFAPYLPGLRDQDVWSGLLAFDRPTWIRPLNRKTTFFISGQFFWNYMVQKHKSVIGGLDLPTKTRPPNQDPPVAYRDDIHRWEMLVTLAIIGFYRGGSVVPSMIYLLDPVNSYSQEFVWGVDYFVTPNFAVNLAQRFFINPKRELNFEPWGLGGLNGGRSETGLRFTYQF